MSVTNEIVKFIAGIELDPKDKEAFTKALKESNDICTAFRHEIAETEKEIEKLTKAGKVVKTFKAGLIGVSLSVLQADDENLDFFANFATVFEKRDNEDGY